MPLNNVMRTGRVKNVREKSVEPGVPVTGRKSMKCRANRDILVDCDSLAVWCKHRCIIVVVSYSHLYVCRVDVARVGVLYVHGHIEERM